MSERSQQLDARAIRRRLGGSGWQIRPHPFDHALAAGVHGFALVHRQDHATVVVDVCDAQQPPGVRIIHASLSRPGHTSLSDRALLKRAVFPGAVAEILDPNWRGKTLQLSGRADGRPWDPKLVPVPLYDPDKLTPDERILLARVDTQQGRQ